MGVSEIGATRVEEADRAKPCTSLALGKLELEADTLDELPVKSHTMLDQRTPDLGERQVRLQLEGDAPDIIMGALYCRLG